MWSDQIDEYDTVASHTYLYVPLIKLGCDNYKLVLFS